MAQPPNSPAKNDIAPDSAREQASTIFREVWSRIAPQIDACTARLPKEIIWLGGAPGSGKGTNTAFILRERGITAPSIVTSDLLDSPEMKRLKDGGNLVGDADVIRILFEKLLDPIYHTGVVVDGFPRTRIQVECVKLLWQQMVDLRAAHGSTAKAALFPKPIFQIVVLYVEEKESIERQLKRGRQIIAHNDRVRETGIGVMHDERVTDLDEERCRKRYRVFMEQTYNVLQSLKQVFHFHIINAQGDIASVERAIINEFQYQSSLELDEETFDAIHHIPLASEIVHGARQHLVSRLESYQRDHGPLFARVISAIEREFLPAILLHAMTGLAKIVSENELFADPMALSMLVDVLNERGYRASATVESRDVPIKVDPITHYIICAKKPRYRFELRFQGSQIRRGM